MDETSLGNNDDYRALTISIDSYIECTEFYYRNARICSKSIFASCKLPNNLINSAFACNMIEYSMLLLPQEA